MKEPSEITQVIVLIVLIFAVIGIGVWAVWETFVNKGVYYHAPAWRTER